MHKRRRIHLREIMLLQIHCHDYVQILIEHLHCHSGSELEVVLERGPLFQRRGSVLVVRNKTAIYDSLCDSFTPRAAHLTNFAKYFYFKIRVCWYIFTTVVTGFAHKITSLMRQKLLEIRLCLESSIAYRVVEVQQTTGLV